MFRRPGEKKANIPTVNVDCARRPSMIGVLKIEETLQHIIKWQTPDLR
jgi:hypothetical protein